MIKTIKFFSVISCLVGFLCLPVSCTLTKDDDNPNGNQQEQEQEQEEQKPTGELTLEVDEPLIRADGVSCAVLTVKMGETVIAEDVTFYDAQTNKPVEIPDMKFTTTTPGKYSFWAAYKTKHTDAVSVTAISAAIPELAEDTDPSCTDFARKVLIQQYTGTGCGFCPYMIKLLRKFAANSENDGKWELAAIHSYNENDPAYISASLDGAMGVGSYPTLVLDLDKNIKWQYYNNLDGFQTLFDKEYSAAAAKAGIALSTILDGNQLVVKVGVKAAEDNRYGICLWVLENGIYAKQTGADGDDSFNTHNNCVRIAAGQNSANDFSGTKVDIKAGETEELFYLLDVEEGWVGENLHVLGIVTVEGSNGFTANNVVSCAVNSSVGFSYR